MGKFTKPPHADGAFFADKETFQPSDSSLTEQGIGKKNGRGKFDPEQQAIIGLHLQALYDEVVKQPLPDKLKDLLGSLDQIAPKADDSKKD